MKTWFRKATLSVMAGLTIAAGVLATETPASAARIWPHGGGGWHHGGGHWVGGAWVPFVIGGAIVGAACYQLRPMYDVYGRYIGRQWVWVC